MEMTGIARKFALYTLLSGLVACGSGHSVEDHVARANTFIDSADYNSATIELKSALQLDSESAEARYLLGKVYLEQDDMPSAEKEFQRALQLGWPGQDIQPALARALLEQNEFARARELSPAGLTPAAEATLLALQSQAAMALGDSWDAEELIDKAIGKTPDSTEALLARARLLVSRNELDDASAAVDRAVSLDPKQGSAWAMAG